MFDPDDLDDDMVEQLLTGRPVAAAGGLSSFVADVGLASAAPGPVPSPLLASVFAAGIATEKGDLPATAGSNVHGPAPQASGLPKWRNDKRRRKNVIQVALGKLAALGLVAKVGVATGAIALAGTTIATTSVLTPPDEPVVESVVDDDAADVDEEGTDDSATEESSDEADEATEDGDASSHGAIVSDAAKDHSHDEECGNHGRWVSAIARGLERCNDSDDSDSDDSDSDDSDVDDSDSDDSDSDDSDVDEETTDGTLGTANSGSSVEPGKGHGNSSGHGNGRVDTNGL